jgi:disulfide oxidoreductase YuzD
LGSKKRFDFFIKLIDILGSTENTSEFYRHIPDSQGFFPMLAVQRTMVRDERMRTKVVEIAPKNINSMLFEVPASYKLYVY